MWEWDYKQNVESPTIAMKWKCVCVCVCVDVCGCLCLPISKVYVYAQFAVLLHGLLELLSEYY